MGAIKSGYLQALREWLAEISVVVYFLVMIFASCSWIVINGIWVELPLMVTVLPEGWALPSYLAVIIQVSNVAPLVYIIANKLCPNRLKDWPIIYVIIISSAAECFALAFLWDRTDYLLGQERSVALIVLSGLLALVDCTASLIFLPFMALFKPQYMVALYIGKGLCGFVPGIVGLVQSLGSDVICVNQTLPNWNQTNEQNLTLPSWNQTASQNTSTTQLVPMQEPPLFSVQTFFLIIFAMLLSSGIAFTFLNFHSVGKKEMVKPADKCKSQVASPANAESANGPKAESNYGAISGSESKGKEDKTDSVDTDKLASDKKGMNVVEKVLLLIAVGWAHGVVNGVIPSMQSYSSLPYSNTVYTLTVRLASLANPLACIVSMFLQTRSVANLLVLTLAATVATSYQLYLASTSPHPPLMGTTAGEALAVSSAVLLMALFSYVKVTAAVMLRDEGRQALLWCGAVTQFGSFTGAVVMFVLINVYNIFTAANTDSCSDISPTFLVAGD